MVPKHSLMFEAKNFERLKSMASPAAGVKLVQLASAMQWLRSSIIRFAKLIQPLLVVLEAPCNKASVGAKPTLHQSSLADVKWSVQEHHTFESCRNTFEACVRMAHRDRSKCLYCFVDAFEYHWAGITAQFPMADINRPQEEKWQGPPSFLSRHFTPSQLCLMSLKKEAFSVMAMLERLHWLASRAEDFDLRRDQDKIVFIFNFKSLVPDLTLASVQKILRCAARITAYNYTRIHFPGNQNRREDPMLMWTQFPTTKRLVDDPPSQAADSLGFEWPSEVGVSESQQKHLQQLAHPRSLSVHNGLYKMTSEQTWIPDAAENLQLKLCVALRTFVAVHHGEFFTKASLKAHYFWDTLKENVDLFVTRCLHCLSTIKGAKRF